LFSGMGGACPLCPLYKAGEGCKSENSPWGRWYTSKIINTTIRKAAANRIVKIVEAWEPEKA
jgi:hypothetical protein